MLRKSILKSITAALLFCTTTLLAKERTPVETFISGVKETNTFVTVSDIWAADNNFDQTEIRKNFTKALPLTIDYSRVAAIMQQKNFAINLVIPGMDGKVYELELAHYRILTNDFEVHAKAGNTDTKVDYTPGLYYRGVVKGIPGSMAAFSFFNNEVYGVISIPEVGNITVAPNTIIVDGKELDYNSHYLLYCDSDIKNWEKYPKCETDKLSDDHLLSQANKTTTTPNNKVYNNCKQINWFYVADFSMFGRKAGVTNCTNYITSLMNNIGLVYMNEGIMIGLKYVQVNTTTDAYQTLPLSSSEWLDKFGEVTQNTMHGCDLAMLLTTKGGSMGGIAWLGVLCASYNSWSNSGPYAFCNITNNASTSTAAPFSAPYYSWDVSATAHEMGHNLGSRHTHACVWGPTRTTAIDGCTTIEGSCPNPGNPSSSVKGTIMSYCHLVGGVGISFNNGFGLQPGDTIRYEIANASCGTIYKPNVALATSNRVLTANRECTDVTSGITYYFKNSNTVANTDDTLVLMVKKNGNNIGTLNNTAFSVTTTTLAGYGGGSAQNVTFPSGTAGVASAGNNYATRRFWRVTYPTGTTFSTPVDVYFPMLAADTSDVNGSVPGPTAPFNNFRMYTVEKPTIDPNPSLPFTGATGTDISVHSKGTSPSTSNWVAFASGSTTTMLAMYKTSTPYGGGAFYANGSVSSVDNILNQDGVDIFPNPTTNEWFISLKENFGTDVSFQLFSADGRTVITKNLQSNSINTINAANLPTGMYFYRIIGGNNVATGNLLKN